MIISVIALLSHSQIENRHLLTSLKNQEGVELEVLLFHPENTELPGDLPEEWSCEEVSSETRPIEVWNMGMEKALGLWVCFTDNTCFYHPKHFQLLSELALEKEVEGVYSNALLLNEYFFPVATDVTVLPVKEQWPIHFIGNDLALSLGAFMFSKTALSNTPFDASMPYYSPAHFLLEWALNTPLERLPVRTVKQLWKEPDDSSRKKELRKFIQSTLKSFDSETLPKLTGEIVQALYQRKENYLAEQIQNKPPFAQSYKSRVLWLTFEQEKMPETIHQAWHTLATDDWQVIVLNLSTQTHFKTASYTCEYSYRDKIFYIDIYNIPSEDLENKPFSLNENLFNIIQTVLNQYQINMVHLSTLKGFSLLLAQAFGDNNLPVCVSVLDSQVLDIRSKLLEQFDSALKQPVDLINQNNQIYKILNHHCSHIFYHDKAALSVLKNLGINENDYSEFSLDSLNKAYKTPILKTISKTMVSSEAHRLTHFSYLNEFTDCKAALDYEVYGGQFIHHLHEQNIPSIGISSAPKLSKELAQKGYLIQTGGLRTLKKHLNIFDGVHTAFTCEKLSYSGLVDFLKSIQQSMKKQSPLVIRLNNWNTTKDNVFWANPLNLRPYPVTLIQVLLEYCGFQIEHQGVDTDSPTQDQYIVARLHFQDYPPVNMPVSTPAYKDFWDMQIPTMVLPEEGRVLMIGPQLAKFWKMNKVFMEAGTALTLDINELTEIGKSTPSHTFRYTANLLKTLSTLNQEYEAIYLQGVLETLWPEDVQALLEYCHTHLSTSGKLFIQTLMTQPDGDIPELFWESALNTRPYPNMTELVENTGFKQSMQEGQLCQLFEFTKAPVPNNQSQSKELPDLPESIQNQLKLNSYHWIERPDEFPIDHQFYYWETLEHFSPAELVKALDVLYKKLPLFANLMINTTSDLKQLLSDSKSHRIYLSQGLSGLFQQAGFHFVQHWDIEDRHIWSLKKLISDFPADTTSSKLIWYSPLATTECVHFLKGLSQEHELSVIPTESFSPLVQESLESLIYSPVQQPVANITHQNHGHLVPPNTPNVHWIVYTDAAPHPVPEQWIQEINLSADSLVVSSQSGKQHFINAGVVQDKIEIMSPGIDTDLFTNLDAKYILETQKDFKFLFRGEASYASGLDVLLKVYFETFQSDTQVSLLLSITQELDFDFKAWLEEHQTPNSPEIILIPQIDSLEELAALYKASSCFVSPHRLGDNPLYILQAMAAHCPVITSETGAALDFCTVNNSFMIDMQQETGDESAEEANTLSQPDESMLKIFMLQLVDNPQDAQQKQGDPVNFHNYSAEKLGQKFLEIVTPITQQVVFRHHKDFIMGNKLAQAFKDFDAENYEAARDHFTYVLTINPYQPDVQYNLGTTYLMLQDYENALEALSQSLRDGKCTADLCLAMSTALKHLGDHETSEEFLSKAKELDSSLFAQI